MYYTNEKTKAQKRKTQLRSLGKQVEESPHISLLMSHEVQIEV